MLKELEEFGLSEKEARIYLAALEIGRATADQLAKHAGIVRPTTYVQIDSLMKKGLMSTHEEGKKTYFAAESPIALRRVVEVEKEKVRTREEELVRTLPELLRLYESAGNRPVVRFFPGKEGVTAVREEILNVKSKEMLVVFSFGHLSKIYSQEELNEYSARRRTLGIHSKGIYTFQEYFEKAELSPLTERRFIPKDELPLSINLAIFDDKVAILDLGVEHEASLSGLIIQNPDIATSMKSLFNFLWQHAQKDSHS